MIFVKGQGEKQRRGGYHSLSLYRIECVDLVNVLSYLITSYLTIYLI